MSDDFRDVVPVWERHPCDSDESWEAFRLFRDARPPRRLLRAGAGPIGKLHKWYKENAWAERVAAFDMHLDHIWTKEREDTIRLSARHVAAEHIQALTTARRLLQRELDKWLIASEKVEAEGLLSMSEVNKLLDNVVKLDRLIRGESTEKVVTDQDLSMLNPEDLRKLRDIRKKMNEKASGRGSGE